MKKLTVLQAIKLLSSSCDGAEEKDGQGFNKPDSYLNLWADYEALTSEQEAEGFERLNKYRETQLNGAEITITESKSFKVDIIKGQRIADRKTLKKAVEFKNGTAIFTFPYDEDLIIDIKKIPGRKWNGDKRNWELKLTDRNVESLKTLLDYWFFIYDLKDLVVTDTTPSNVISILKDGKVSVKFDYRPHLVANVKIISGRKYNSDVKSWEFELSSKNVKEFRKFIVNNMNEFEISKKIFELTNDFEKIVKKKIIQQEKNKKLSSCVEPSPNFKVKSGLTGVLRTFQEAGVEYIVKNKKVILGDEMGTGKTIQGLAAVYHTDSFPCLVICPNTVKYNWQNEWSKWLPNLTVKVIESANKPEEITRADVYIVNYHTNVKYHKELVKLNLKSLIIDESHYLKSGSKDKKTGEYKIVRVGAAHYIVDNSKLDLIIELSGTAITNRPKELISQLNIINKLDEFGGFWEFAKRYCNAHRTRFGLDMNGATNLDELHTKLREVCYIRRDKKDVLKDLPDMQIQTIEVDITNRKVYNKAEKDLISYLRNEVKEDSEFLESINDLSVEEQKKAKTKWHQQKVHNAEQAEHLVKINTLKQLVAEGKLKASTEFIGNIIENEKLVVFTIHKFIADEVSNHFNCKKIVGNVKAEKRQEYVDDFQNNPKTKLIVINLAAGREGITLTAASKLVFLEQGWTPAEMDQAAARIHRISQKNTANIYNLLGKNTIDIDIYELIAAKREITNAVNSGTKAVKSSGIMNELINRLLNN